MERRTHRQARRFAGRRRDGRAARRPPYPKKIDDDKWLVWGRGRGGRFLQVIFVLDPDDTVFVIHARPLTDNEKRRYRKRTR